MSATRARATGDPKLVAARGVAHHYGELQRSKPPRRGLVEGIVAVTFLAGLAFADGGYWPPAWGWSAIALLWVTALALALRDRVRLRALDLAYLAGLAAFLAWTLASIAWSAAAEAPILEGQRALVYLAGAAAALFLVRPGGAGAFLAGVWGAIVLAAAYGLATRLFPDRLGVFDSMAAYRLAEPIGYWNALAILAAVGALLALGLAARARSMLLRAGAAASLLVLMPTLFFTFSRGGWIALGIGLVAALALDRRRLQLVTALAVLAPWPAVAVWTAFGSDALTHRSADVAAASEDGRRLAVLLVVLALAAAVTALAFAEVERRVRVPRPLRIAYAAAVVLVLALGLTQAFERYGSPPTIARTAYEGFLVRTPPIDTDLNVRLFNLSGNGRPLLWRVAWEDHEARPWTGTGAGSYEQSWVERRPEPAAARDAHSLYLEVASELGRVGVVLLGAALAVPLVAAVRARRRSLAPVAAGAYVAYLAHAGVDWDWEIPAVTLAGLWCGASLLVLGRGEKGWRPGAATRTAVVGTALALAGFAFLGLLGNRGVAEAEKAAAAGDWAEAEAHAREAAKWAPWSSKPLRLAAEARLARGDRETARETVRAALEKNPRDWRLWLDLALASDGRERQRATAAALTLNPLGPQVPRALRAAQRKQAMASASDEE